MQKFESEIKNITHLALRCVNKKYIELPNNTPIKEAIKNLLTKTEALKEPPSDFWYLLYLMHLEKPTFFNEEQLKQWSTYSKEFWILSSFFTFDKRILDILTSISTRYINVPVDIFKGATECSKNTFSRIINALEVFMPYAWVAVIASVPPTPPAEKPERKIVI